MIGGESTTDERAVVLLSGGLDSATAAALIRSEGREMYCLSFRYGQRHHRELDSAARLARSLGASGHRIVTIDEDFFRGSALTDPAVAVPKCRDQSALDREIPVTYVPARNTVFLSYGLALAEMVGAGQIVFGANALDYSGYPDCRPEYVEAFERMANLATRSSVECGHHLEIRAPLLHMSKAEIVRLGASLGLDFGLTWSCYDPREGERPCGECDSCLLRAKGFHEAGLPDPLIVDT